MRDLYKLFTTTDDGETITINLLNQLYYSKTGKIVITSVSLFVIVIGSYLLAFEISDFVKIQSISQTSALDLFTILFLLFFMIFAVMMMMITYTYYQLKMDSENFSIIKNKFNSQNIENKMALADITLFHWKAESDNDTNWIYLYADDFKYSDFNLYGSEAPITVDVHDQADKLVALLNQKLSYYHFKFV